MFMVIEHTPGYLPDVEGAEFETLQEAAVYAQDLFAELVEEKYVFIDGSDPSISGAVEWWYYFQKDENDLGRQVTITQTEGG
jgi:hypothetical protein